MLKENIENSFDLYSHTQTRSKVRFFIFLVFFYFFLFRDPLERLIPIFKYADEVVALCAIPLFIVKFLIDKEKIRFDSRGYGVALLVFFLFGIIGNFIYNYQTLFYGALDAFLCLKFWFAIYFGKSVFHNFDIDKYSNKIKFHCKIVIYALVALVIIDNIFLFFSAPIRYGLRSTRLFYSHPTYFAATCVLLTAIFLSVMRNTASDWISYILLQALLCSTLRMKAVAAAVVFIGIAFFIVNKKMRVRIWMLILAGILVLLVGWDQILFYFFNENNSDFARSQLLVKGLQIANDCFPLGAGFGTFGSHFSDVNYSPLYALYGIDTVPGLEPGGAFISDTFWPMILAQTGWFGLIAYIIVLVQLFRQIQQIGKSSIPKYAAALSILAYLLISSTSESAFVNPMAIPLAIWLGVMLKKPL